MNQSGSHVENLLNVEQMPSDSVCNNIINCNDCCENFTKDTGNIDSRVYKSSAVWTYNATLTLLKLYEEKLEMLETPKKKTRIWIAISESLKEYNIEVTPNQVRWKINALTKKYKQCVDAGQIVKFKYFRELNNIYAKYSLDCDNFVLGEFLHKKKDIYQVDTSKSNIPMQMNESKAIIELRKIRLANRIESDRLQSKLNLEKQWLDYLIREEKNTLLQDEIFDKNLKKKEEKLELLRYELEMKESLEIRKLQSKEREQDDLIRNEREKCEMLKQIFANKIL